jgi:hypothetical protein
METGLFEIQAEHLSGYRQTRHLLPDSRDVIHAVCGVADLDSRNADVAAKGLVHTPFVGTIRSSNSTTEFARCFLRLANLPNFALDRLSRYEATLWRQVGRILFALDALDRRKPQERRRHSRVDDWRELPTSEDSDC